MSIDDHTQNPVVDNESIFSVDEADLLDVNFMIGKLNDVGQTGYGKKYNNEIMNGYGPQSSWDTFWSGLGGK